MNYFTYFLPIRKAALVVLLFGVSALVAQDIVVTLEAEAGVIVFPAKVKSGTGYSANSYVGDNDAGSSISFADVVVPTEGTYEFRTHYTCMQMRSIAVKVNAYADAIASITTTTPGWDNPPTAFMSTYIYMKAGANSIRITPHPIGKGGPNMDKFEILTTDVQLPKPGAFPMVLEAETARLYGDLKVKPMNGSTVSGISGGKYIGDFNLASNSYMQFTDVEIPEEGTYELKVFSMGSGRALTIKVNRYEKTMVRTVNSPNWDNGPTSVVSTFVYLDKGLNRITMGLSNDNGPNLDKFELHKTSETIARPKIENIAFVSDYLDGATLTAAQGNEHLVLLNDNDESTFYEVAGTSSVQITALCDQPLFVTGYLLSAGLDSDADVTQWEVESSVDGVVWKRLTPTTVTDLNGATLFALNRSYGMAATESTVYYRLTAKGMDAVQVGEWQLFGSPYVPNTDGVSFPNDITHGADISAIVTGFPEGASGDGWSENFQNLFNRRLNNKYYIAGAKQFFVQVDLPKAYHLDNFTLTSADAFAERDPKRWTFSGYNEQLGWIELCRYTEFSFPSRYATMRFDTDPTHAFTSFLLDVEDNNGGADSQLLKFQLFGREAATGSDVPLVHLLGCSVWSDKGQIVIQNSSIDSIGYQLVSMSGIPLVRGVVNSGNTTIHQPKGAYILVLQGKEGNDNRKVMIR